MLLFSILISYRNRDVGRVRRCLTSLANQTFKNFEVLFVDYGSDLVFSNKVQHIVESLSFKYIYNDTRGMPWNQPHALNTGLASASGKFIVRLDVDIILAPHFFESINEKIEDDSYFHSRCYYLPEHFDQYDLLFTEDAVALHNKLNLKFKLFDDSAKGLLLIIHNEILRSINGFDEFYYFWGVDDADTSKRLVESGCKLQWLDLEELPVYHQWHPNNAATFPSGWYETMIKYYSKELPELSKDAPIGYLYTASTRPALRTYLNNTYSQLPKIELSFPKALYYALLYKELLHGGDSPAFYVEYEDSGKLREGRISKWVDNINNFLSRTPYTYRLIDKNANAYNSVAEIRDMLFYFIITMKEYIEDYYFIYNQQKVLCILFKK